MSIRAYQIAKEWLRAPGKTIVFVTADDRSAAKLKTDLEFFTAGRVSGEVCLFEAPDVIPYTHLTSQPDIWMDRLRILYKLAKGDPLAIVAPVASILRTLPPPWIFDKYHRTIHQHDTVDTAELARFLTECGYINQPIVEDEGAFSIRGGIIDLYSPSMDRPVRCELDGDEISSIRTFDPATQRSSFSINSFSVVPARNIVLNEETKARALSKLKPLCDENNIKPTERRELSESIEHGFYAQAIETLMPLFYEELSSLSDFLPKGTKVFVDDEIEITAQTEILFKRLNDAHASAKHIERIVAPDQLYATSLRGALSDEAISYEGDRFATQDVASDDRLNFIRFKELKKEYKDPLVKIVGRIKEWQEMGLKLIVTCHTTTQAERVLDIFKWHGLVAQITEENFVDVMALARSIVWIMLGSLSSGFISEKDGIAILTDEDIFGTKVAKRTIHTEARDAFTDFSELEDGDYVIHKDHGIARYLGLKNIDISKTKNDFLLLEYLGGDKLYLPVWRINLISRYISAGGGEGGHVALDKLGGTRWTKTQAKVNSEIRTMAMELLKIYAARKVNAGFAFGPRDHLLEEFEASFPYDETPDQWRAIEEVLEDMQRERPADRLICGDVGYGKTEVAMRATFKAVEDKKQVAILVPTTVLAFQHYETFMQRFANWPVRIEMLSRFRKKGEQKHVMEELSRGMVDIVIGTHRLLQRDVKFHDLGLLIIDEEHRFGVAHKERIRKIKSVVDTITMTATPIPRTLHMSLSGMRDISIINTPPANRLAIRTYVAEFDEELIRGAIMAELSRGGQVFFVHNRVETIGRMAEIIAKIVPEAKIVVGHGQMEENKLENVMIKFLEKEANVLLCTTIIESGLDVPSANTMIINRADTFGLAQLYQLRGRVGRSNVQAYAYLLTPSEEVISTIAQKRLSLLQRYTELGSGFQIAMHDLEIRGAGNILGAQQSGHINAIGYDMYVDLLERAIRQLQGKPEEFKLDVEITLPVPAYLPTDYIEDQGQRLVLYRRLAAIDSTDALDEISKELNDRFGKPPELVKHLLGIVEIKIIAKRLAIESIQYDGKAFAYKFHTSTPVKPETILKLVQKEPKHYAIKPPASLVIFEHHDKPAAILSAIKQHLKAL